MGIRLNELKNRFNGSVMVYIKGSLVGIISLAITTLFASYWITELADLDARAINLSGSLRMESYQLGMYGLEGNKQEIDKRIAIFEEKLRNPIFQKLQNDEQLNVLWQQTIVHWQSFLKPALLNLPIEDKAQFNLYVKTLAQNADAFVIDPPFVSP